MCIRDSSRSLAACEGAVLIVDASQGVEAQTLANTYLAAEHGLEIVPVINKIDLPAARPEEVRHEIEDIIGIDASDAPLVSAKQGTCLLYTSCRWGLSQGSFPASWFRHRSWCRSHRSASPG